MRSSAPVAEPQGDPFGWLADREAARTSAGLRRSLHPRQADSDVLDLAGNDYLALARHPAVIEAGVEALRTWGAGSTGSRLVTGSTQLHADLESALAAHVGAEAGLVFSSGYAANLGALTALAGSNCLIVSDERNHASLVDACRLARSRGSEVAVTPHADPDAVAKALAARPPGSRAIVVTDSVFSADGDMAPLAELAAVVREAGAALLVDEAHAIGAVGPGGCGAVAAAGLAGAPDVVVTATLSKALGSQGGAVLGPAPVIAHLVDSARTFIFDTGLAPACAGSALAALRLLQAEPQRAERVREIATRVAVALDAPLPAAAVISLILGEPERALAAAAACRSEGIHVGCFRPPTVPERTSRLRIAVRADLSDDEVERAIRVIRTATGISP
jgi:8-amino-7-oxononanoate synthase